MKITRRTWVHPVTKLWLGQITTVALDDGRWASHYGRPMTDDQALDWASDQLEAPEEN